MFQRTFRSWDHVTIFVVLASTCGSVFAQDGTPAFTPLEWQPKLGARWNRDSNDNSVEDEIEAYALTCTMDLILDLNGCPSEEDLERFSQYGDLGYVGKFLTVLELNNVEVADALTLGQDVRVAMVEINHEAKATLDVSNPTLRVRSSGEYSPNTLQDLYPQITGAGVNIAIIDTGVDDGVHESLPATKFVAGYNVFTHLEGNPDDDHFHGTHVAGIALGTGGASGAYRGIAPGAGLVDIKVLNAQGTGSAGGIIEAIDKCILRRKAWHLGVINMSLGESPPKPSNGLDAISQAVNRAVREGIVAVVAAGNSGKPIIAWPAAADDAITVAASSDIGTINRSDDAIATFSSRGPRKDDGDQINDEQKPELAAPGVLIASAVWNTSTTYGNLSGTSMASPHIAGLAALLLQANPNMSPLSVKQQLLDTAEDFGPQGWDQGWGYGLANAFSTIDRIATTRPTDIGFQVYCHSQDYWWYSPDVVPSNPTIVQGEPNSIFANFCNNGPNPAKNIRVRLGVYNLGTSEADYEICEITLPDLLPPGDCRSVECPWTPQSAGHGCLKAEIIYPYDSNGDNNCAQHNVRVDNTASPVSFTIEAVNTTGADQEIYVVTDPPQAPGWTIDIDPPEFVSGAYGCPADVLITLTPDEGTEGSLCVNVRPYLCCSQDCEVLCPLPGGVTVIAQTQELADCNTNGFDDPIEAKLGASKDCNTNGLPDECDLSGGTAADCNANGVPDACDRDCNTNAITDECEAPENDCDTNGIPDECEDTNTNGVSDACDIADGASEDCNTNGEPDETERGHEDCNVNGTFDLCESLRDCNTDLVPDTCNLSHGSSADCDTNEMPDECDEDCNTNVVADICEVAEGEVPDCNTNGSPDECDADCNQNGVPDVCETAVGTSADCDGNGLPDTCDVDCNGNNVPDTCDIFHGTAGDCDSNGIPDGCEGDCNENGSPDPCDVVVGTSADCGSDGVPDECEDDCNANGAADSCDLVSGESTDCNSNGLPDECDLAECLAPDCNTNAIPDLCEDCNTNGLADDCDVAAGRSEDSDGDGAPDECVAPCHSCVGDVDGSGAVDGSDVQCFVECVVSGGALSWSVCGCADMNRDGVLGPEDMAMFVERLLGTGDPRTTCR